MVSLCYDAKDWEKLNETIVLLSKRRAQLKQAVTAIVQQASRYVEELDETRKLALIETLRNVSEGKMYVSTPDPPIHSGSTPIHAGSTPYPHSIHTISTPDPHPIHNLSEPYPHLIRTTSTPYPCPIHPALTRPRAGTSRSSARG